uniref:Aquaporin-3 n=1 Tax=Anthurium amnicola TaxID=1678845 RepID=A0A1D1Z965_9ARAE
MADDKRIDMPDEFFVESLKAAIEPQPIMPAIPGLPWQLSWEEKREAIRPFFAEAMATFFYVFLGGSAIATLIVSGGLDGSRLAIAFVFAFGTAFAITFAAHISGGHLSVAFSCAFAAYRKFPWKTVPLYFLAHIVGAFLGTAFVYACFYPTIDALDLKPISADFPDLPVIVKAFVEIPKDFIPTGYIIWTELIANIVLSFIVFSLIDHNNKEVGRTPIAIPLLIGFVIFCIIIGIGFQGVSINPARDLGGRLFIACVYGGDIFKVKDYYFWIPLIVPNIGSLIGGGLYDLMVYKHAKPKSLQQ